MSHLSEYLYWMRLVIFLLIIFYGFRKRYHLASLTALLLGVAGYYNFILVEKEAASFLLTVGVVAFAFHVINLDKKEKRGK